MNGLPVLSILIFLPIVAGVICLLLPGKSDDPTMPRLLGLGASLLTLLIAILALIDFMPGSTGVRLEERASWIPQFGISYHLGADGLNILLIALTAILTPPAILASWNVLSSRPRLFIGLILLLEGTIIGALSSLDLILYFVFWEAMLIPMYLLISTFGGARRGYAALKFFIYTSVGSLLMFLAMLYLSFAHSSRVASAAPSFDLRDLIGTQLSTTEQRWLFLAFALAFAIKLPIFPLHSWLPDAYSQSPVTVLVLATMLVKVGAYSFLRFAIPLFPQASSELMPILAALATVGIIYGGLVAAAQRDMIRLLAYSSLAHLGFIGLGIFALDTRGAQGSLLQMVNHGVSSGALFLIAGMIAARVGTFDIAALGGLAKRWPILTGTFVLAAFSSLGLPGLNGFVGEFLILLGTFRTQRVLACIATFGVLIAAIYVLRLFRRTMFGVGRGPSAGQSLVAGDLSPREVATLAPLLLLIIWIGVYPSPFLQRTEGAVRATINAVQAPAPATTALTVGATALTITEATTR
ncbi:MAG TPA: NADH-quinone oxidoreductase subunit M [Thermomicrobiales bacterium]|jgi:NADH-quinone oxidoreductase subunit M